MKNHNRNAHKINKKTKKREQTKHKHFDSQEQVEKEPNLSFSTRTVKREMGFCHLPRSKLLF